MISDEGKKLLEEFHPAGQSVCSNCRRENKAGEWFPYKPGMGIDKLCPECNNTDLKRRKAEQVALYASGEEKPEYTDQITCPWCGYEDSESHEEPEEDNEHECQECGGVFSYNSLITITYSSERVRPGGTEAVADDPDED